MGAIGGLVEVVVWCLAWSIGATLLALSRFNEPDARFNGLPRRVWAALLVVWLWPVAWLLGAWFSAAWTFWLLLGIGPAGMLWVLVLGILHRHSAA